MHPMDTLLQSLCPTVMIPRFEPLPDLNVSGHRLLAAQDGLWIEVRRPWLHARMPLATTPIKLPYGDCAPVVRFRFGLELHSLLARFAREARAAFPDEHAAWLVWDEAAEQLEYEPVRIKDQGGAHIRYDRPACENGRFPCIDLHSHGTFDSRFSSIDDGDDDDTKLAICFGHCDRPALSASARLCVQGSHHDLNEWLGQLLSQSGEPFELEPSMPDGVSDAEFDEGHPAFAAFK